MQFTVLSKGTSTPSGMSRSGFLEIDEWDDNFRFSTQYYLYIFDQNGVRHSIGHVKIGQLGMTSAQRRPAIPAQFDALSEAFFSLGQDDSYYDRLNDLGDELRDEVFLALRDIAVDTTLFEQVLNEEVTEQSLLRFVSPSTVRGQFHRLAKGGARLSRYEFTYIYPETPDYPQSPPTLMFTVEPESEPPTNIHVLIGRNGVGKTRLLNRMTRVLANDPTADDMGRFLVAKGDKNTSLFANLVSVTFSAFDPFDPLPTNRDSDTAVQYSYIGLKQPADRGIAAGLKSSAQLSEEFSNSAEICSNGARASRWCHALEILEADPLFREAEVTQLASSITTGDEFKNQATKLFNRCSSGHKIVLLTITRLVETVEERTLVLLDEPEAHLHPPLLSAFVRALSDLLVNRNGVAIIATHSPVVLQEVPKSCAWKMSRTGPRVSVTRPEIETFGESVGTLTHEVFGLEVTQAGFHKLLSDAVQKGALYDDLVLRFGGEIGGEARAIARSLIAQRNAQQ